MNAQVLKKRLEKDLDKRITATEWLEISNTYVREYDRGELSWEDLCGLADDSLRGMRRVVENNRREERGEPLLGMEIPENLPEELPEPPTVTDITAPLSERAAARAQALIALDNLNLRTSPDSAGPRQISSRIRPQGGFDETLPQWVIELEIEAWVPAEDVRSIYQYVQRRVLAKTTKTQQRTFKVAQFVWEEELRAGERPSWPALFDRWKKQNPDDNSFDTWREFRRCFQRGDKAARPQYKGGDEPIIEAARRLQRAKELWDERRRFGWFGLAPVRRRLF